MSEQDADSVEHVISVTRIMKHQGESVDPKRLLGEKKSTNLHGWTRKVGVSLDVVEEVRSTFECSCGERFIKEKTAAEHLQEVSNGPE